MNPLKEYLRSKSYKSIFNKLYSNFLIHDFEHEEILNFSLKFNDLVNYCSCLPIEATKKIFIQKNEYGFVEIFIYQKYDNYKNIKPLTYQDIDDAIVSEIINRDKISEDIVYSYLIWQILKLSDEEQKKQRKKEGQDS